MSYIYREREREDFDRPVTIKRYVVPSEDREDRREFSMSRDDFAGDRELVIRRKTEREEPMTISRYERDIEYEPRRYERDYYEREYIQPYNNYHRARSADHLHPGWNLAPTHIIREKTIITRPAREAEYDVVRRSETDEDPYYYHSRRRVREYDDRRSRRELSPGDSISQASRRHGDRDDYSSDDSMVYIRKETTRDYDDDHPHHKRHLAEGALVAVGAAELMRSRSKREGKDVSHGLGRAAKTAGAGALGAVAVNAAGHVRDYYRSKSRSRHRAHSFDDERSRHSHHSHRSRGRHSSRSRSRSHSHSRAKTLLELGLGAAAVAAGVAAIRNNKNKNERKSRSRTRSRSRGRALSTARSETDDARSQSKRRQHIAGAGLAGAAAAGLIEHARSRSKSRKGERPRSQSRIRKALPILAAGLGTAGITGLYEKNKAEKDGKEPVSREHRRSRSRSRARGSEMYPDPARDSAGLIEYGNDPVAGSIPAEHYYGQPPALQSGAYYSDGGHSRRHSRSRSRSRAPRYSSSSGSDRERRRSRKHRSRSRSIAEGVLGATGLGYAAHKYKQSRDRKDERSRSRSRSRTPQTKLTPKQDMTIVFPATRTRNLTTLSLTPSLPMLFHTNRPWTRTTTPHGQYFPPPPDSTTNLNATPQPYNPGDYPPPPGAAPPAEPYSYGAAGPGPGPGPGPEHYAPRPRRADENVSTPTDKYHTRSGLINPRPSVPRSGSQPPPPKSVTFNLTPEAEGDEDAGYNSDDSDSTIRSRSRPHYSRRRSSSVPYPPMAPPQSREYRHHHSQQKQSGHRQPSESESDSTIDLPDRFDSYGRLLKEKEDPALEKIEDLINKFTRVLF
ncbi:hypothetical protein N7448_004075 [Penicillium atrosanguineum]|nr:hypothetical protein N7448_004075 [Penicillium atrosanguineum]